VSAQIETIQLEADGMRAAFAPAANMILHSLRLRDQELLDARNGLAAYAESGSTMGVPLLHPWANRLGGLAYTAAGTEVALDPESALFKRDGGGLPIHGALPALLRWDLVDADAMMLLASLDWSPGHRAFPLFPFPHRLTYDARLGSRRITITIALEPSGDVAVPVSFGFHPYLRLSGGARADARVSLPVRRALVLDASMIPTGETAPWEPGPRQLSDTAWDDGFTDLVDPARFLLGDGESEISVTFLRGYRFAQVFAPRDSRFVCFEPMTAPANALVTGGPDLPLVEPGGRYEAAFEIAVA
jgi:aldose 1-epimerase